MLVITQQWMVLVRLHDLNCLHRQNLGIESHVDCFVFDANDPFLSDVTNDQGLGGHAYLDPCFVEND